MRTFSFKRLFTLLMHERWLTLPTLLTIARIALAPFVIAAIFSGRWSAAFLLFFCASVTDLLDGALARLLGEHTILGAFLDPIADKFLMLTVLWSLTVAQGALCIIPTWFFLLVLCKELALVSGVILFCWTRGAVEMRPSLIGKVATALQMVLVGGFLLSNQIRFFSPLCCQSALAIAAIASCGALINYTRIAFRLWGFVGS